MDSAFFGGNRQAIYRTLGEGSVAVLFAGNAPRQSADAFYPFFANRNFVYISGIGDTAAQRFIFLAEKTNGCVKETLFIMPKDMLAERWNGQRLSPEEARALSGIQEIVFCDEFSARLKNMLNSGRIGTVWLDLFKFSDDEAEDGAYRLAEKIRGTYPYLSIMNLHPLIRAQRTIKQPCEVEAMKKAMEVTKEGILAMMRASKPGMYEYEYKAEFDRVLTGRGILAPAFPSIISAGKNNFCIHYYAYTGRAEDGDMILNDVGACYDYLCNDVSRGWPCNGRFSEKQRLLYTCAYNTSEYMFGLIKPGMPMQDVDLTARKYCYEQLKSIGLCDTYADIGKYMWHGGAHHVGFDVHDDTDMTRSVSAGMVFCVDIGIYCEEWGIGFRLEDNCLVTENGCVNLSAAIPRSITEIETAIAERIR